MATDPVCGMQVDERTAAGRSMFEGKSYYFCSTACQQKFEANPPAHVTAPPPADDTEHSGHAHHDAQTTREPLGQDGGVAVVAGAAPSGTRYTCPMHPEIVRDAPGDCPICGMALAPIASTGGGEADDSELRALTRRLWVGIALSLPLVVLAMSPMIGLPELFGLLPQARGWIEFVLGTPVVLWVGGPILRKFWLSLVHRTLNMYTLIGLGVGLAYVFSLAAVLIPGLFPLEFREHDGAVGTYFEAAAVIVTLVILGDFLQLRAMGQTSQAIQQLLKLAPNLAWRLRDDGSEEQVRSKVAVGNRLRVKPGEKVPVDGTVLEGSESHRRIHDHRRAGAGGQGHGRQGYRCHRQRQWFIGDPRRARGCGHAAGAHRSYGGERRSARAHRSSGLPMSSRLTLSRLWWASLSSRRSYGGLPVRSRNWPMPS
jgi:Cu+-exporting ATPase